MGAPAASFPRRGVSSPAPHESAQGGTVRRPALRYRAAGDNREGKLNPVAIENPRRHVSHPQSVDTLGERRRPIVAC